MPNQVIPINQVDQTGLILDRPAASLPPNAFSDCLNVRFDDGAIRKMEGEEEIFTGLGFTNIRHIGYWENPNRSYYVVIERTNTADEVYLVGVDDTGSDPVVARVIKTPTGNLPGRTTTGFNQSENWQVVSFNGGFSVVINNGIDAPHHITENSGDANLLPSSNTTRFDVLPNWQSYNQDDDTNTNNQNNIRVSATAIVAFGNVLVAGGLIERMADGSIIRSLRGTVRSSNVAAPGTIPQNWNPFQTAVNTADELNIADTGEITGLQTLQGNLYAFTSDTIHQLSVDQNGLSSIFISNQYGAMSNRLIVEHEGTLIIAGVDDIYSFAGHPTSIQSISDGRVRRYFYDNLNAIHSGISFMIRNRLFDEIWLCYPTLNSSLGNNDEALIWNYRNNTWTRRELNEVRFGVQGPVTGGGVGSSSVSFSTGTGGVLGTGRQEVQTLTVAEGTTSVVSGGINDVQTITSSGSTSTTTTQDARAETTTLNISAINNAVTRTTYTTPSPVTTNVNNSVADASFGNDAVQAFGGQFGVSVNYASASDIFTCGNNGDVQANGNIVITSRVVSSQGGGRLTVGQYNVNIVSADATFNTGIFTSGTVYSTFTVPGADPAPENSGHTSTVTIPNDTDLGIPAGVTRFKIVTHWSAFRVENMEGEAQVIIFPASSTGSFTSTNTFQGPTTSSPSTRNGGANWRISGPFSDSGTFGIHNSSSTAASDINSGIQAQLPTGWSSSASGSNVIITSPAGVQNDIIFTLGNGSATDQTNSPSPGSSSFDQPAGTVSGSIASVTQGQNEIPSQSIYNVTDPEGTMYTGIMSTGNLNTVLNAIRTEVNRVDDDPPTDYMVDTITGNDLVFRAQSPLRVAGTWVITPNHGSAQAGAGSASIGNIAFSNSVRTTMGQRPDVFNTLTFDLPDVTDDITVDLVRTSNETLDDEAIAGIIRDTSFTNWTTSGTGRNVIFTRSIPRDITEIATVAGLTGVAFANTATTEGQDPTVIASLTVSVTRPISGITTTSSNLITTNSVTPSTVASALATFLDNQVEFNAEVNSDDDTEVIITNNQFGQNAARFAIVFTPGTILSGNAAINASLVAPTQTGVQLADNDRPWSEVFINPARTFTVLASANEFFVADSTHGFNGNNIQSYIERRKLNLQPYENTESIEAMYLEAEGVANDTFDITVRPTNNASETADLSDPNYTFNIAGNNSDYKSDVRITGRLLNIRLENNSTNDWNISHISFGVKGHGER